MLNDYEFQLSDHRSDGIVRLSKRVPLTDRLLKRYDLPSKALDQVSTITLCQPHGVESLIPKTGGEIIHMSEISSITDQGKPVVLWGVIAKARQSED